jgi:hypothetical protein
MRYLLLLLLCATAMAEPQLVSVKKISDAAPHSAFTDLVYFKDRWLCTFREGKAHVSPDGAICVLESADAEKWDRVARLTSTAGDLRDPKLSITPDNRLMLTAAIAMPKADNTKEHRTFVWFSDDGRTWGAPKEIGDRNMWLWRVAWHEKKAYAVGYSTVHTSFVRLYESDDGKSFSPLVTTFNVRGEPSEAGLAFGDDHAAYCLLRCDAKGQEGVAQFGSANPPYKLWTWAPLNLRIGGPALLRLSDGRFIAAGRFYQPAAHTALAWLDPVAGKLTPFLKLPSSGDTSYPGLVLRDGLLRVSYYSSHEGKASIYLATVKLQ